MLDNTDRIRHLLDFPSEDTFYFLQIFKRRKDNPGMEKDMVVLANYCIKSLSHFDKILPDIVKQCQDNTARAYIRLNKRSYQRTALKAMKLTAEYIEAGQYRSVRKAFDSAAGQYHSDPDRTWIIDIDWKDVPDGIDPDAYINDLISKVKELVFETGRDDSLIIIPSKNGLHLISRPFNLQKFREYYSVDVHKDNPTILYAK